MANSRTAPVILTILLVTLTSLCSGQSLTQSQKLAVDRTVYQIMRCAKIPALSLTFVSLEGSSIYHRGYGTSNPQSQTKVDERSVFCLGGGTQAFTAVLLAKLIDENENVTWSTPVQDILGRRVILPDMYRSENLNLKDILAMRSGLAGMDIVPVVKPYDSRRLETNLRYVPEVSGFREGYVYNEVLFTLIEEVVNTLGGDNWYNLIRQHILQPLDMKSTVFIGTFQDRTAAVDMVRGVVNYNGKPYVVSDESYNGQELVGSASSLCTSSYDMSRWIRFLLYGGRITGNNQLIREEALKMTYQAIQSRGEGGPEVKGYSQPDMQVSYTRDFNSLGWINGQYRGFSFVSQDGSLPGYQSLATIFPSRSLGVYTAFTGDQGPKSFAAKVLINILGIDMLMQGNPWFTDQEVCQTMSNLESLHSRKEDPYRGVYRTQNMGYRPLEDFVGMFRNFAFGDVHVKLNESKDNTLTMEYGLATYKMEPTNMNNTFQLMARGGDLWYSTNADYYRDNNRLIAEFSSDPRDTEHRIHSVKIAGFDKNVDPVFSINARPPRYEDFSEYDRCSACQFITSPWTLALLLIISFICLR